MITIEENDLRYYIKESSIPNAGLGVFAKEYLRKGDFLEIIGVYVPTGSISDLCSEFARRYKFAGSEKGNMKIIPLGFAAIINHIDNPKLQNCRIEYVRSSKRSQHAGTAIYRFLCDILPHEELIGNYGHDEDVLIKVTVQNNQFLTDNKEDIAKFLDFNLYNLKSLDGILANP